MDGLRSSFCVVIFDIVFHLNKFLQLFSFFPYFHILIISLSANLTAHLHSNLALLFLPSRNLLRLTDKAKGLDYCSIVATATSLSQILLSSIIAQSQSIRPPEVALLLLLAYSQRFYC